jgi:hypothetical protein
MNESDSSLKKTIKEYVDLMEQIQLAKEGIKIVAERKSELENKILNWMSSQEVTVIQIPSGKISVSEGKAKKPFNKDSVCMTLNSRVEPSLAKELSELVFSSREVTPFKKIKIKVNA